VFVPRDTPRVLGSAGRLRCERIKVRSPNDERAPYTLSGKLPEAMSCRMRFGETPSISAALLVPIRELASAIPLDSNRTPRSGCLTSNRWRTLPAELVPDFRGRAEENVLPGCAAGRAGQRQTRTGPSSAPTPPKPASSATRETGPLTARPRVGSSAGAAPRLPRRPLPKSDRSARPG
jgi:hypothetical protein